MFENNQFGSFQQHIPEDVIRHASVPNANVLSRREVDVITHIKDGLKNPEIANLLGLSTKTVENHVRNILLKLGVKNRTQAVVHALKTQIIAF